MIWWAVHAEVSSSLEFPGRFQAQSIGLCHLGQGEVDNGRCRIQPIGWASYEAFHDRARVAADNRIDEAFRASTLIVFLFKHLARRRRDHLKPLHEGRTGVQSRNNLVVPSIGAVIRDGDGQGWIERREEVADRGVDQ